MRVFIDGTVAGTPADLTVYIDEDIAHDHTYFGNGCPNGWGTDGDGGSITPCSTRIVKDGNEENQKNGTYYNYQAASSGNGASITTNNTNTPDTFCPLGWQLPYGGSGGDYYDKSKSLRFLTTTYNITDDSSGSTIIKAYPFSYVYSGDYLASLGRLYYQTNYGHYWTSTVVNDSSSYRFNMWNVRVMNQSTDYKGYSMALRCDYISDVSSAA